MFLAPVLFAALALLLLPSTALLRSCPYFLGRYLLRTLCRPQMWDNRFVGPH